MATANPKPSMTKHAHHQEVDVRNVFGLEIARLIQRKLRLFIGVFPAPSFMLSFQHICIFVLKTHQLFNLCSNMFQFRRGIARARRRTMRCMFVPAMGYAARASTGDGFRRGTHAGASSPTRTSETKNGCCFLLLSLFVALRTCPGKFLPNRRAA